MTEHFDFAESDIRAAKRRLRRRDRRGALEAVIKAIRHLTKVLLVYR